MARGKRKLGAGDLESSKEIPQKRARPAVPSKRPVIIGTSSSSVVRLGATPQREIPDSSPTSKHKSKATPIVHIVEAAVNTPRRNARQARQIEDSPSSSEDEVGRQGPEVNTSDSPLELSYPSIDEFWDVFGDEASTERLSTCKNMDEYENMVRYFHARLVLFVRGLHYDKYETVFRSTTPAFYHSMDKNEKIALNALFENAYNWIETQLITRINSYVQKWYKTEAGEHFRSEWMRLDSQKRMMSLRPLGPQNINELMMMNDRVSFEWTKTDVTSFWLPCLAALTTEEFEDGTIGWLRDDTDLFWLNALGGVALGLIARVATSPVAIRGKSMDKKAMQTIFRSVLTFNHVANELSPNLKDIVRIKKETPSDPLTLARVKPHNYDQDNNEEDIKIPPSSPFSSTVCSPAFVRSAHDTDDVSCKLFVALPAHQARAKNSRDELRKEHSNTLGEQAIHHLFPYKAHRLSCYRNPPIVATEQVAIGQYYAQLELDEQTEFHIDNMEKEIERLHTLVEIELQKVVSMEQDIVFLRSKEVERKNAIRSLQEVWLSGRQIGEEIGGIKSWLREPIHAQAKRGLTDEQQARIGDLGLESSPVERGSLLSRSRPSSRQPTAGLHGTGTGYLRQPRFGHKVESIDLTNNSGSERGPLRASHTRPSPIIQIKDERIRSPIAQEYGPNRQPTRQPYAPERRTISSNLQPDQHEYQAPASVSVGYDQYAPSTAPQTTQGHGSWPDGEYGRPSPYASRDDRWRTYPPYQDERQSSFAGAYRTDWQPPLGSLGYEYDPRAPYASSYEYDRRRHYNSAYEYERRPVSDQDYEAERKPIRGHAGKDEAKPPLAQEFERKTIPAREPVQEPPPAPASAGQKSRSNPPDGQERPALAAKDPECQAPNPDTSREKVQIVQVVQEVDKPRSRSLSPAFNEPTDSGPAIPLPSDTQYAATSDLAKLYDQDIE